MNDKILSSFFVRVRISIPQSELEKYKRLAERVISDEGTICLIGEYWIMMLGRYSNYDDISETVFDHELEKKLSEPLTLRFDLSRCDDVKLEVHQDGPTIQLVYSCEEWSYVGYLVMVIDTKDIDIYDDEIVLLATKEVVGSSFMNMLRPM